MVLVGDHARRLQRLRSSRRVCVFWQGLGLHEQLVGRRARGRLPAERSQVGQPEQLHLCTLRLLPLHRPAGRRDPHFQLRPPGPRRGRRITHANCQRGRSLGGGERRFGRDHGDNQPQYEYHGGPDGEPVE